MGHMQAGGERGTLVGRDAGSLTGREEGVQEGWDVGCPNGEVQGMSWQGGMGGCMEGAPAKTEVGYSRDGGTREGLGYRGPEP